MKDTTKAFIFGLAVGIVTALLIVVVGAWLTTDPFSFTTQRYDEEARQAILDTNIPLTPQCTELFYYRHGFLHHDTYIAFSGTQKDLDSVVERFAGKKLSSFTAWPKRGIPPSVYPPPTPPAGEYQTIYYHVAQVKHGLYTEESGGSPTWHLIYDREGGRVFYYSGQ